ncbi:HAD-IA family hydrolase [Telmatospirillum sp. J64-1]|uniref:HAD-IA family hydrolase n=1 Tax=Telmatospirillum sp. J64-1 TaxID=2502183 RepID=UPI00115F39CE|nr:HAD-IA family hydrolase [Telmatospirillum sp. J64-1]
MPLRAIIFDVDGTLAETEEAHRRAYNLTFAAMGLGWVWDRPLYKRLLGVAGGCERLRHWLSEAHPGLLAEDPGLVDAIHRAKTARFLDMVRADEVAFRPGVRRLIAEAAEADLRLAVATATSRVNIEALLKNLGPLGECFTVLATGEDSPRKKPAPDVYLAALSRLGLPPQSCLALEDSHVGLTAARAAGLTCVVTVSAWSEGEDFTAATAVLSDLGEPERPFNAVEGETHGKSWADLDLLRRWHGAALNQGRRSA